MKEPNINYEKHYKVDVTRYGFPAVSLTSCRNVLAKIDLLKQRLFGEFSAKTPGGERLLKGALNEAEALAWQTSFPHLFFPELALEKALAATQSAKGYEQVQAGGISMAFAA